MEHVETFLTWITGDGAVWMVGAGIFLLGVLGLALIAGGVRDYRSRTAEVTDTARILDGLGLPTDETLVLENRALTTTWQRLKTVTTPRYSHVPAVISDGEYVGQHHDPDEKIIEEADEEYVGRHRLDPSYTIDQVRTLFTQTRELPVRRTLNPAWRTT